jgi:hypothetical protein
LPTRWMCTDAWAKSRAAMRGDITQAILPSLLAEAASPKKDADVRKHMTVFIDGRRANAGARERCLNPWA